MRDDVLPQAQNQLDALAAQMSSALSDTTTAATPVTVGANNGFDADISGLSNGNTIQLSYTDGNNVQHSVTIVRVDDPTALPLPNTATANPNDTVIGVNFSGGPPRSRPRSIPRSARRVCNFPIRLARRSKF